MDEAAIQSAIEHFVNHEMTRQEAEQWFRKKASITSLIGEKGDALRMIRFRGLIVSYGVKPVCRPNGLLTAD